MSVGGSVVYDMSSMSEGTPSIMVKRDWLAILDNQNQSYSGNQCVIDTSQLANSNKYMNYREGYLLCPLMITLTGTPSVAFQDDLKFSPNTNVKSCDYAVGLKNWYGSIVHSLTLDYNGTTVSQQTPYIGMWNTFRLMTTLSLDDLRTQGSTIGFYPDKAQSAAFATASMNSASGGTFNNCNAGAFPALATAFNSLSDFNDGLLIRQQAWNLDPDAFTSLVNGVAGAGVATYGSLFNAGASSLNTLYKSYIFNKVNPVTTNNGATPPVTTGVTGSGCWQVAISAIIYLRHLHPIFEFMPLLKGTFMKLTLNLNQSSVSFTTGGSTPATNAFTAVSVSSPLGGVSPLMVASLAAGQGASNLTAGTYIMSLNVGKLCLNSTQNSQVIGAAGAVAQSPLSPSILLYVPAYSFNPVFESSYLSSPVKKIIYTDVYQYQVLNISAGGNYNNLVTNGIANIKSVMVFPFYNSASNGGLIAWQSPFDPAGGGATSPFCLQTQFNIQISGQNAIYNTERYSWEQFQNQFYGCHAQNAGMDDGFTSGLVGQLDFDCEYCYYYVNCSRMLPVEEAVPKSVNVLGLNTSSKAIDLYIFVEYGVEISIDVLSGARV